jgi:hypothetical protein
MSVRALLAAILHLQWPRNSDLGGQRYGCFQQLNRWLNVSLLPGFSHLRGLHESPELRGADHWQPRIPSRGEAQGATLASGGSWLFPYLRQ